MLLLVHSLLLVCLSVNPTEELSNLQDFLQELTESRSISASEPAADTVRNVQRRIFTLATQTNATCPLRNFGQQPPPRPVAATPPPLEEQRDPVRPIGRANKSVLKQP